VLLPLLLNNLMSPASVGAGSGGYVDGYDSRFRRRKRKPQSVWTAEVYKEIFGSPSIADRKLSTSRPARARPAVDKLKAVLDGQEEEAAVLLLMVI